MRLSCPNCGTLYDVPDSALPAAGQHVQCTQCHTRWFARGPEPATRLTEDQILARLETRKPLTLVSGGRARVAEPAGEASAETAAGFVWEGRIDLAPAAAKADKIPPPPEPDPAPPAQDDTPPPPTAEPPAPRRFTAFLQRWRSRR